MTKNPYLHFVPTSHWVEFGRFDCNRKRPPTLNSRRRRTGLDLESVYTKDAYIHSAPTPHSVIFLRRAFNQKAFAYTLHWCRTGTNLDTEIRNRKRVPTLCADIALGQILTSEASPKKHLPTYTCAGVALGLISLLRCCPKKRLCCAGVAMDRILILRLWRKMPTRPAHLR